MRASPTWRATAALAVAILTAASVAPALARPPDVVLVVVDTLRADRLGCYGNQRGLTPFLDELAAGSHLFERAYAPAPWTNPSVASLFTSRYQSQHGITGFHSVLSADELTLAEMLRKAGYATAGFSANGLVSRKAGFDQGFDTYRAYLMLGDPAQRLLRPNKRADEITAEGLAWLDRVRRERGAETPLFLYLHYMEPHTPYAPPAAMLDRVRGPRPPLDVARLNQAVIDANFAPPAPDVLTEIRDAYDAEVMAIDGALRVLADALAERGMLDEALLVVTADHGEEFQDHGGMGHGRTLYDEVLHVPLMVRTPGQTRGARVDRLVSLVDVAPTVVELTGAPRPPTFAGVSFARELQARGAGPTVRRWLARLWDDRPVPATYAERRSQIEAEAPGSAHESAVMAGRGKLIRSKDGTRVFYALDVDPGEQRPNQVDAAERDRLETRLAELERRAGQNRARAGTHAVDERTKAMLRALGYAD